MGTSGTMITPVAHKPEEAIMSKTPNLRLNRPDMNRISRLAHTLFFFGFEIATASCGKFGIEQGFTRGGEIDII
jgi:hypothetical protein